MKTKQLLVKTNVRTGAVPCTRNTHPYFLCYVGRQMEGALKPQRESVNMSVGNCLDTLKLAPSEDYACYVA